MSQSTSSLRNKPAAGPVAKKQASRACTVVSLERSAGPNGAAGNDWYRYVINSPGSPITGYRRGKMSDVKDYLDECTAKLAERMNSGKAPRAPSGRKPNRSQASG